MVKKLIIILLTLMVVACSVPKTCCGQVKDIDVKKKLIEQNLDTGLADYQDMLVS